jgi:hypothetical protein
MNDDFDPDAFGGVFSSDAPPLFTMVPEWITYSGLKPVHREFWTVLASCVNHARPDTIVWPAGPELADAMGIKKPEQLKPYREALETIGAIVPTLKRYANGMRQRYIYDVRFHPPADYTGPRSRTEWLDRRKERIAAEAEAEQLDNAAFENETAGQPGTPKNGGTGTTKSRGTGAPKSGGAGAPGNGGAKPDQEKPDQQQPQTAPSARSAGDGRRPSTGSSARGKSSGSTAANGTAAPDRKPARSRGQVLVTREVQQVLEMFPEALREALVRAAGDDRPKTVVRAIEQQLGAAIPVEPKRLGARVARRWVTHGYTKHNANGTLSKPVGAAVAMLKPGPCPVVECEDGELLDTDMPCRACIEREKNRKAAQEAKRKAAATEREEAARRRACPHCQIDRGTNGKSCHDCTETISSLERDTNAVVAKALAEHRAMPSEAHATEFRAQLTAHIEDARATAVAQGATAIGQALAMKLAAEGFVRAQKRHVAKSTSEVALAAPAGRPDPQSEPEIPAQAPRSRCHCPGPDGEGCPGGRLAVGLTGDGLCARCLVVVESRKQPAHSS